MEEGGARRIVVIVAIAAVAILGVFWYWQRAKQRALRSGNVYIKSQPPGQNIDQSSSASAATAGNAASSQWEGLAPAGTASTSASAAPASTPSAAVDKSMSQPAPARAEPLPMTQPRGAIEVPATDTIPRNPPSGLIFAGAGKYQLYRQGDITWRLDTDTGRACIIFATDIQWSRTRVWDQGCGAG